MRRLLGGVVGFSLGLILGLSAVAYSQGQVTTIANWPLAALHVICDSGCAGAGGLTDAQLRATPVPISGTVTATGPLTDTQLRATPVPISGTVTANVGSGTQPVTLPPATLGITALSTANASVTATLPAVASQFHYITALRVMRTCTTAITGSAALAITSTNLPGTMAWTTGNACAVGSTNEVLAHDFASPVKSSVVNTNTTVVCPALGAAGICRITVHYFTGT